MAGIREELNEMKEILQKLDEQKETKKKGFKIPFFKKVTPAKAKQNYVTLIKINENAHLNFKTVQIEDQTLLDDGIPRLAGAGYVMYYKKNPVIILPNWSVEPFSTKKSYESSLGDGSNTVGYRLLLAKMKSSAVDGKVKIGGMMKWILGIGLLAIIGFAFLTGGG